MPSTRPRRRVPRNWLRRVHRARRRGPQDATRATYGPRASSCAERPSSPSSRSALTAVRADGPGPGACTRGCLLHDLDDRSPAAAFCLGAEPDGYRGGAPRSPLCPAASSAAEAGPGSDSSRHASSIRSQVLDVRSWGEAVARVERVRRVLLHEREVEGRVVGHEHDGVGPSDLVLGE